MPDGELLLHCRAGCTDVRFVQGRRSATPPRAKDGIVSAAVPDFACIGACRVRKCEPCQHCGIGHGPHTSDLPTHHATGASKCRHLSSDWCSKGPRDRPEHAQSMSTPEDDGRPALDQHGLQLIAFPIGTLPTTLQAVDLAVQPASAAGAKSQVAELERRQQRMEEARKAQREHHHTDIWTKLPHSGPYVKESHKLYTLALCRVCVCLLFCQTWLSGMRYQRNPFD